ncbi:MAG: hypothetical protein ABIG80_03600, partial [Patescibacteria group bacterium]
MAYICGFTTFLELFRTACEISGLYGFYASSESALNIFSGNLNHRKDSLYSQKPAKGIIFLQKNPSSRNWLKPENLNKY